MLQQCKSLSNQPASKRNLLNKNKKSNWSLHNNENYFYWKPANVVCTSKTGSLRRGSTPTVGEHEDRNGSPWHGFDLRSVWPSFVVLQKLTTLVQEEPKKPIRHLHWKFPFVFLLHEPPLAQGGLQPALRRRIFELENTTICNFIFYFFLIKFHLG